MAGSDHCLVGGAAQDSGAEGQAGRGRAPARRRRAPDMNAGVLTLHLLAFAYIGVLPRIFFRKGGRFHLWWWLTALPFLVSATILVLGAAGVIEPFPAGLAAWRNRLAVLSVFPAAGSIALISLTLGTHRIP